MQSLRYPSGFATKLGFWSIRENGVAIPDAVWCGQCHPGGKLFVQYDEPGGE